MLIEIRFIQKSRRLVLIRVKEDCGEMVTFHVERITKNTEKKWAGEEISCRGK